MLKIIGVSENTSLSTAPPSAYAPIGRVQREGGHQAAKAGGAFSPSAHEPCGMGREEEEDDRKKEREKR